jgi:hypothetical protein
MNVFIEQSQTIPEAVGDVIDWVNWKLSSMKDHFFRDPKDPMWNLFLLKSGDEWIIAENYEEGYDSTIRKDGKWYFRGSYTGLDYETTLVKVCEHWVKYYTGN